MIIMVENLLNEEWKDIKGYEGMYQISNKGRIKSFRIDKTGKLLSIRLVRGYPKITLKVNGVPKDYYVHRIEMETFNPVENMENLDVNHIDENKENNDLSNLEWLTHKENLNYGTRGKRAGDALKGDKNSLSKPVECIETGEQFNGLREAERILGIPSTRISQACKRHTRTAGGYHWKYL